MIWGSISPSWTGFWGPIQHMYSPAATRPGQDLGSNSQRWGCDPSQPWLRCGDVCGGRTLARVSWGHCLRPQLRPAVPLPTEPTGAVPRTADRIPAPDWCPPTGRGSSSWPLPWGRCSGCMGRLAELTHACCVGPGPQRGPRGRGLAIGAWPWRGGHSLVLKDPGLQAGLQAGTTCTDCSMPCLSLPSTEASASCVWAH